jgi:hypothetical protein
MIYGIAIVKTGEEFHVLMTIDGSDIYTIGTAFTEDAARDDARRFLDTLIADLHRATVRER